MKSKPTVNNSLEVLARINPRRPVHVYRNLATNKLSIRQDGIVVCHTENVVLKNTVFRVQPAGRRKVLREKQKNVHAYVKGMVVNARETDNLLPMWEEAYYNPYTTDTWINKKHLTQIKSAEYADIYANKHDSSVLVFNCG